MKHEFYKTLLDSMTDGVYFVDLQRTVTYWNKAAERLSGYSAAEIVGKNCSDNYLIHVDEKGTNLCLHGCPLAGCIASGESCDTQVYMHHKYGHRIPVYIRAAPMRDDEGNIIGAVEVFTDNRKNVNLMKEIEKLREENLTDNLTGLGNRRYGEIVMEELDRSMKESSVSFGVIFADIDFFKKVNDSFGHHAGDRVLAMVSKTLESLLRPLDALCRWGGEEFIIFVPNTTVEGMQAMCERLRLMVEHSGVEVDGNSIEVTCSFGGAVSLHGELCEDVITRADKQLYISKESGRNRVTIEGN